MANVFEKTKNKFENEETSIQEIKQSNFNYEEHEIKDSKLLNSLVEKEENIQKLVKQAIRVSIDMARNLFEAREELASYKSGTFYAWFESLGLNKDFVYRAINKYELFLETNNPRVMDLSKRAVEFIKKNKDVVEIEEIEEIINSENPTEKIKEIKDKDISEKKEEIQDIETIENLEKKEKKLKNKIEKTQKLLEELEIELNKIQKQKLEF